MGAGGSTNGRPGTATVIVAQKRPQTTASQLTISSTKGGTGSALPCTREINTRRPTDSCCSHYRDNHLNGVPKRNVATPATKSTNSLDEDIEAIVADEISLSSLGRSSTQSTPIHKDVANAPIRKQLSESSVMDIGEVPVRRTLGELPARKQCNDVGSDPSRSSARSQAGQHRVLRSYSRRSLKKRPSSSEIEVNSDAKHDAKDSLPEVDFAKFKKVNHRGASLQKNGRIIHHQESDLLWRLGLISPEAYQITSGTRSAPSNNQGPYLKTPSYDLTEEQLMANIEKEFECTTAI